MGIEFLFLEYDNVYSAECMPKLKTDFYHIPVKSGIESIIPRLAVLYH